MSEPLSSEPVGLERFESGRIWFPGLEGTSPDGWEISIAKSKTHDTLLWLFELLGGSDLPRGYHDSVRQRILLWKHAFGTAGGCGSHCDGEGPLRISASLVEGEPLPAFAARVGISYGPALLRGILDLIRWLRLAAKCPRLLSCIEMEDFFVFLRSNVGLSVELVPILPLIRNENPVTEFEVARKWTHELARICAASQEGWKRTTHDYDPRSCRFLRPLLAEIDGSSERDPASHFEALERAFLREFESKKGREEEHFLPLETDIPRGPLACKLRSAFRGDGSGSGTESRTAVGESPFSVPVGLDGEEVAVLLPPEKWFASSAIDRVNRRTSSPFLKTHPNFPRIRSIFCDESLTAIVLQGEGGISLPTLLEARSGLAPREVVLLAGKVSRALSQFESADFEVVIESPWQIELHLVDGAATGILRDDWWHKPISEWPAWDVKIRVERPAESFVTGLAPESWLKIRDRLVRKDFPALVAWILGWRRFQIAMRQGSIEAEPIGEERGLDSLFGAVIEFYEPGKPGHRARFLELIGEGLGSRTG